MMKKHTLFKTVQLVLFVLLAAGELYLVFSDPRVFHAAAEDSAVRLLCIGLWAALGLSFLFLFLDFSYFLSYRKDYKELDYAVHSDPFSGIANRFSCDLIIAKYADKPLPQDLACIMLDISNLARINREWGHAQGNTVITDFAGILSAASEELCFVGRNGGNKFLAIFEEASDIRIQRFLNRVADSVSARNADEALPPIVYRYGTAFREGPEIRDITQLIALSDSRIRSPES